MTKLIVYQEDKMVLSPKEFMLDVNTHTKLRNMDNHEYMKQVVIFGAYQAEAFKITKEILDFDKKEIRELILKRFAGLSINELYYAFKLERFGELDPSTPHYNRFDAVFVSQVLGKYMKWRQNIRMHHNLPIGIQEPKKDIPDEEKKELIRSGVMSCYDHYRETLFIEEGKTYVYEVLYDLGVLPTDPETKKKAYEEAKEVIRMDTTLKKAKSRDEKKQFKELLSEIEKKKSDVVVVFAKQIVLGKYFRGIDRSEILNLLNDKL